MFKKIARMLICLTLAGAALVPSALAAPRIGVGRVWGPVSGHGRAAVASRRGGQVDIGSAYGPVTAAPPRGRIDIGSAYGPVRVPGPCKRGCAKHATSASRVHR